MSVGVFMDILEKQGVTFGLVDGVLCVEAPVGALSEAQRHELVARRDEVARLVYAALTPYHPAVPVPDAHPAQLMFGEVA